MTDSIQPPRLMTEKAAASYLSIAYRTLWGWRKQGIVPHIKFGKQVRYSREDLDEFIRERRFRP